MKSCNFLFTGAPYILNCWKSVAQAVLLKQWININTKHVGCYKFILYARIKYMWYSTQSCIILIEIWWNHEINMVKSWRQSLLCQEGYLVKSGEILSKIWWQWGLLDVIFVKSWSKSGDILTCVWWHLEAHLLTYGGKSAEILKISEEIYRKIWWNVLVSLKFLRRKVEM